MDKFLIVDQLWVEKYLHGQEISPSQKLVYDPVPEFFTCDTSQTKDVTLCFMDNTPLSEQIEKWKSTLETYCMRSFNKIRIRPNKIKPPKYSYLIDERNAVLKIARDNPDQNTTAKIKEDEPKISEAEAIENWEEVVNNCKS